MLPCDFSWGINISSAYLSHSLLLVLLPHFTVGILTVGILAVGILTVGILTVGILAVGIITVGILVHTLQ